MAEAVDWPPKLTPHERMALEALEAASEPDEFWASFSAIGALAGLDRPQTKRAVRRLARRGYASFKRGLWTDDGEPAGSGYAITKTGVFALDAIKGGDRG